MNGAHEMAKSPLSTALNKQRFTEYLVQLIIFSIERDCFLAEYLINFSSFDSNKKWHTELPKGL